MLFNATRSRSVRVDPSVIRAHDFAFALTLVLIAAGSAAAKPSFAITPEPAWATKRPVVASNPAAGGLPSSIILDDEETRVTNNRLESFYHRGQRVDTSAGLEDVSQLRFYFEPSYQRLAIHFIRIIRGNETIDALKSSETKVVQAEEELDDQLYNGTLVVVTFLNDLRVGDVVEYAYTVTGANPVFGGRFARRFYLAGQAPIQTSSIRVLMPVDRVLQIRSRGAKLAPRVSTVGGEKEYLWEQTDVPAIEFEDSTPTWSDQVPSVTVSEFADWGSVVQWALPLYATGEPPSPEVKTRIAAWINQFPAPEQRMVAALRFVQQEIRYLGIELGPYSHRPNPVSRTLMRRFGDCKDKSLLLATILRNLGIDAAVALVSVANRHSLDEFQPSPEAFDHAIVQARIGGKTYWLDPTYDSQRGTVAQYYDPPFERALVLREDSKTLEIIPFTKSESPTTMIQEKYVVRGSNLPVSFAITSTYRGPDADRKRAELSIHSPSEMARFFLNYYAQAIPSIKAEGLPTVHDDQESDTIVITEKYIIDSFWKDKYHYFSGDLIYDELRPPDISKRSQPLAISHPTFITQSIEVDLPSPANLEPGAERIGDDAFRFDYEYASDGNIIKLTYSLQTLRDNVLPDSVARYLSLIDKIHNSTGLSLPQTSHTVVRTNSESPGTRALQVMAVLVGATVLFTFIALKLRRRAEEKRRAFGIEQTPGGTLATAVRCQSPTDIEVLAKRFKCGCGHHPFKPEALDDQQTLIYDGERLATLRLKCDVCKRANDFYFVKP